MERKLLKHLIETYPNSYELGEIISYYYKTTENKSRLEILEIEKELMTVRHKFRV